MTFVQETTVQRLEYIIGYEFEDKSWAWEAVQVAGSGVYRIGGRDVSKGNQRLAICGDASVQKCLVHPWYHSGAAKGEWDSRYRKLLTNDNFCRIGNETGLAEFLHKNPNSPCATSDKLVATLIEAIFGAVEIDGGEVALRTVMRNIGLVPSDITLV
ncbi:ribonuclease III domain-containing protein [Delphinella strobiligena]|nr:ribonuclease III domain-containing protein [Delphinella strobiligena]